LKQCKFLSLEKSILRSLPKTAVEKPTWLGMQNKLENNKWLYSFQFFIYWFGEEINIHVQLQTISLS
jgi:hypothetical protein